MCCDSQMYRVVLFTVAAADTFRLKLETFKVVGRRVTFSDFRFQLHDMSAMEETMY